MLKDNNMEKYKQHFKAANMLLAALCGLKEKWLNQTMQKLHDVCRKCSEMPKQSRIYGTAIDKGWETSARKIRSRAVRKIGELTIHLEQFKNFVSAEEHPLPKPGDIVAGLLQAKEEFGELNIDLKAKTLSVVTGSIHLEEICFGPFEIRFYIDQVSKLPSESPFRIIALEPYPAGSDCNVTHPHVSHDKLCEGDGFVPIRKAIQQGRLCDFFLIVQQILQTYNPDSPYVSISDWEGISCYDCGYTIAGDDCYYCENCERDYCSSCSSYCYGCDSTVCLGCSFECPGCDSRVCRHCTEACADCEGTFCKDCINDEHLCDGCQKTREDQENEEIEEQPTATPETCTAIQPYSLGQTRVSA